MDFSTYKFSCTSLKSLMAPSKEVITDKQLADLEYLYKKERCGLELTPKQVAEKARLEARRDGSDATFLSAGCKKYLKHLYAKERYGIRYQLLGRQEVVQMIKGIKTEKQAIDLLARVDGRPYYRYKKPISNKYLTAKLDILNAPSMKKSDRVLDIKSCYDHRTFMARVDGPLSDADRYQMQGYLAITGKEVGEVVYCLVGYPDEVLQEQYELLQAKMCMGGPITEDFLHAWKKAEASMLFSDIAPEERVIAREVVRDDIVIEEIYDRVATCRKWLTNYDLSYSETIKKRYL
jgi:hypothetical protein